MGLGSFRKLPSINLPDFIPKALGNPGDICSCSNTAIDFVLQTCNLSIRGTRLIGAVQVMILPIMVDGITSQISLTVNKPGGVIGSWSSDTDGSCHY